MDGSKQRLIKNTWLTTQAPQGKHTFAFRYQPWDVPVGAVLSAAGWILAIGGLIAEHRKKKQRLFLPQKNLRNQPNSNLAILVCHSLHPPLEYSGELII